MPSFSPKSLDLLSTCHPDIQKILNEAIKHFDFTIIEGRRTLETQKQYMAAGKTRTLNSKHIPDPNDPNQWSHAVDIAPMPIAWDDKERFAYLAGHMMAISKMLGISLRWGGDWDSDTEVRDESFRDLVHFELR